MKEKHKQQPLELYSELFPSKAAVAQGTMKRKAIRLADTTQLLTLSATSAKFHVLR